MQGQQPPSSAGTVRGACLARWRWAIAIVSGLALALCGLYLGVPAFRRRVQYVPVRVHILLTYVGGGIYLPCHHPRW
jgi:hypothetical protein